MIIKNDRFFSLSLGVTALFVAIVAATFSTLGIGMLFSGAAISSIIMASSLELGKVVSVSFLYRYWDKSSLWLRSYLVIAVLALMAITSLGIFGWLSAAYQGSSLKYEVTQQQIVVLEGQREQVKSQSSISTNRIKELSSLRSVQETRMSEVLNNPILARNPTQFRQVQEQNLQLIRDTESSVVMEQKKLETYQNQQIEIDKKIADIRLEAIKTKDVVTFQFVADSVGLSLNTTVKWFIVAIIVVFDPLAVCLILAYNVMVYDNRRSLSVEAPPVVIQPTTSPPEESIKKN